MRNSLILFELSDGDLEAVAGGCSYVDFDMDIPQADYEESSGSSDSWGSTTVNSEVLDSYDNPFSW